MTRAHAISLPAQPLYASAMMIRHRLAAAVSLAIALAASAAAQPAIPEDPADWTLSFEPSVWYASPVGRLRLSGGPAAAGTRRLADYNLDSPRVSPFGELVYRIKDPSAPNPGPNDNTWRVSLSAANVSLNDRGQTTPVATSAGAITFAAGDTLISSLDTFTADLFVAKSITIPDELAGKPGDAVRTRFELGGGFRLTRVDIAVQNTLGQRADDTITVIDPMLTAKGTVEIDEDFTIDLQLSVGGLPSGRKSSFAADILAGFQYRPTPNVGVQIGYRLMLTNIKRGEGSDRFEYDGGLAGLYGGLVLRF